MKRLLLIIAAICINIAASSQSIPEIKKIFADFATDDGNTTEVIMSGDALKGTNVNLFRSLTITDAPETAEKIAKRISKCASNALSREVQYINGSIYYAQLSLPPAENDGNSCYLLYNNSYLRGGNRIMIVFLSGKGSLDQLLDSIQML